MPLKKPSGVVDRAIECQHIKAELVTSKALLIAIAESHSRCIHYKQKFLEPSDIKIVSRKDYDTDR